MPRAYLVMGPESSGNRLMTRLLVAAGCLGDGDARQRWDTQPPSGEDPIVWLRSVPHDGQWPDLVHWVHGLRRDGYTVQAVVMTRDWHSQVASQVRRGHAPLGVGQAEAHLRRAYSHIFRHLDAAGVPFWVVSYEQLVQRPHALMRWLCAALGLTWSGELPEPIVDANVRYYREER